MGINTYQIFKKQNNLENYDRSEQILRRKKNEQTHICLEYAFQKLLLGQG